MLLYGSVLIYRSCQGGQGESALYVLDADGVMVKTPSQLRRPDATLVAGALHIYLLAAFFFLCFQRVVPHYID